ncbi:hypothetical protein GRI47_04630 [Erythrobacter pelagi]|uniref:Uncharacterized protein n=1 Tax=Qipengyuania pelagi TaxID=994320 RepID=A0A844Y8H5_9SPHN|nr:hypothetical protein [Qipengyuania pelagi]
MITVSFHDQLLHDICTDLDRAERQYGRVEAQALVTFISDAHALDHAEQLIDLHAGEIIVLDDDSLRVDLSADYRAALVVVGTRFRRADDGRIRWDSVMRLKLVEVSRVP